MKYISFVIPCYNSQDYMSRAIESILTGKEEVEIIIVNDGSGDRTSEIAHEYMKKYPDIIRVIDKEKAVSGLDIHDLLEQTCALPISVNKGIDAARGAYLKVVDSDDWVDEEALRKILTLFRNLEDDGEQIDMLVSNFVYEKAGSI